MKDRWIIIPPDGRREFFEIHDSLANNAVNQTAPITMHWQIPDASFLMDLIADHLNSYYQKENGPRTIPNPDGLS
jgi:hypothetical protein